MNEMMYLQELNNKIVCINYFGKYFEKKRKFIVKNLSEIINKYDEKAIVAGKEPLMRDLVEITGISLNGERLFVQLNNELVLVFKSINMLKNKMFKELESAIVLPLVKYIFKSVGTNVNFHFHKILDKNKKSSVGSVLAVVLASILSISNINTRQLQANSQFMGININYKINEVSLPEEESRYEESILEESLFEENLIAEEKKDFDFVESGIETTSQATSYEEEYLASTISYDTVTNEFLVANNSDFYTGEVYDELVKVMDDSRKTAEMNDKIQDYIAQNLNGQMWGNAEGQGYNNYTIPEKYKNGEFTLNELFDDAAATFDIPKDILVSISQHECGQGYYPLNSYTNVYEQNCGGMMGFLDVNSLSSSHLPNGTSDGFDPVTNPAVSIYAYASTVRFFYDSFKNINVGYGLDSWDISAAMIAIGPGDVSDIDVGFKYRQDYDDWGWSQLNICAPQFKALREAYLNNQLGVNDLTLTVENGVVTHWSDGEMFYYKNGEKAFNKMNDSAKRLTKNN